MHIVSVRARPFPGMNGFAPTGLFSLDLLPHFGLMFPLFVMSFSPFRSFLLFLRSLVGLLCVSLFFAFSTSPALAASGINHAFSYQGRLFSSSGSLVGDGTYAMKFSLYDSASAGTRLWTAAGTTGVPTTVNVTVTNGLFSVSMGDVASGQNALNIDWNQDNLYLGVSVGTDSEMSPRKRLTAVPYAFNSETLQGNYASSSIAATGGNLMSLRQNASDAASAARTALFVQSNGTSNQNDYLFKGNNGSSDVFTINRLGNTTTTGNFATNGNTTLGDNATTDLLSVNAHLLTDLTPWADVSVKLGSGSNRWLSLDAQTINGTTINGTSFIGTTVSSTNGLFANSTSTNLSFSSASGSSLLIAGKQVCLADGTNCAPVSIPASTSTLQDVTTNGASTSHLISAFGGVTTSNLTATGTTSLQGMTFTDATGTNVTSTNLFASQGTFTNAQATNLAFASGTSTNWFGFNTASGTNLSVSTLLVNGESVCLLSGTNCPPVSLGPIIWQDDAMTNIVSLTTSTRAFMLGGNTTSTAGFIWDPSGVYSTSSSVLIGSATNTNLLVGASDYTGGLDPNFSLSGKDVFVQGMIGSLGGLYSATGVVVGASTFYGDGSIKKDDAGDFGIILKDTTSDFHLNTGLVSNALTVKADGRVGIGVSKPTSALDVAGGISSVMIAGQTNFRVADTTNFAGALTAPDAIRIHGQYEYLADYDKQALEIVDISQPEHPSLVSSLDLSVQNISPNDVFVVGKYAYLSDDNSNLLWVFDVSDPVNPFPVTSVVVGNEPNRMMENNGILYVSDYQGYFSAVDISHPESPEALSSISLGGVTQSIAFYGTHAYVTTADSGLNNAFIIDISHPHQLQQVGSVDLGVSPFGIVVSGNHAFVANNGDQSLSVLDLSNPITPSITTVPSLGVSVWDLVAYGNALISANADDTATVFDISNPTTPGVVQTISVPLSLYPSAAVSGRYAFVASTGGQHSVIDLNGLEVNGIHAGVASLGTVDVQTDASVGQHLAVGNGASIVGDTQVQGTIQNGVTSQTLLKVVSREPAGIPATVRMVGSYAFIADEGGTLRAIDYTDPSHPFALSSIALAPGADPIDVSIQGNNAYVVDGTDGNAQLEVIDISNPRSMSVLAVLPLGADPRRIAISGSYAYVTEAATDEVSVIDISHPSAPSIVQTVGGVGGRPNGIAIFGHSAYVASFDGLAVLDISNPSSVVVVGTESGSNKELSIAVDGRFVYTGTSGGVDVFDVADPTNPNYVNTLDTSGDLPYEISLAGSTMYLATNNGALQVFNISHPFSGSMSPQFVQRYRAGSLFSGISVQGRYAYLSDGDNGEIVAIDLGGIETNAINAGSAALGSVQVAVDAHVGNNLSVDGALTVQGKTVCLADGTGCPSSGLTGSFTEITNVLSHGGIRSNGVATQGNYAFQTEKTDTHSGRLNSYDISNPASPIMVDSATTEDEPYDVAVQGEYAYTTELNTGLCVYAIANPINHVDRLGCTTELAGIYTEGRIALAGHVAYITDAENSMVYAVDVSNPSAPFVIGSVAVTDPWAIAVQGHLVYVGTGTGNVYIVNATDPANMFSFAHHAIAHDWVNGIAVNGSYVYTADTSMGGSGGVSVLDFTSLDTPALAGSVDMTDGAIDVAAAGTYVYVTGYASAFGAGGHVYQIDVSDPTTPGVVQSAHLSADIPIGLSIAGNHLFTANFEDSMSVVSIPVAAFTSLDANSATIGSLRVLQDGTVAHNFSVNGALGVGKGGILSAGAISVTDEYATSTFAHAVSSTYGEFSLGLTVGGKNVCLADGTNCPSVSSSIWADSSSTNVTSLTTSTRELMLGGNTTSTAGFIWNPNSTSTLTLGSTVRTNLLVNNGTVGIGVTSATAALDVQGDVQNTLHVGQTLPRVSSLALSGGGTEYPSDIKISGHYAYVADSFTDNVKALDLANPAHPTVAGTTQMTPGQSPEGLAVAGRYLYAATTNGTVNTLDLANPAHPVQVATTTVGGYLVDVGARGRYVYTMDFTYWASLTTIDASNPAAPVVASTVPFPGGANPTAINFYGNYAYVLYGGAAPAGIGIFDLTDPAHPVQVATSSDPGYNVPLNIVFNGNHAYVTNNGTGGESVLTLDVSNPRSPVVIATTSFPSGSQPSSIATSGRYVYVMLSGLPKIEVLDVSIPSAPVVVAESSIGVYGPLALSGHYGYSLGTPDLVNTFDIGGVETNGVVAHEAQFGSLQVLGDATVSNDFTVNGALNVNSGILTRDTVNVFTSSTALSSVQISNSANNSIAVLSVRGGCSNSDAGTDLFLVGNTTDARKFSVRCNGEVHADAAYSSTGADFAEYFAADASHLPTTGDVVALVGGSTSTVHVASASSRDQVLGVVSTKPGFIGNDESVASSTVIVGLIGQIPTHASASSSAIAAGDWVMAGDGGMVVKAQGPGMVIGRTIDPLSSGTGIIQVSVAPQWWAGDLFLASVGGTQQIGSITASSETIASSGNTLVNSPAYTFQGSAWDADSSLPMISSFSLFTAPQSASSSLFTIANTSGTAVLTISDLGDTTVSHNLTVNGRLFLGSNLTHSGSTSTYLFADESVPGSTFVSTNADGFQTSSTYDYAERYSSNDSLVPGDVVTTDGSGANLIRRATSTTDVVLGIVSTRPGFVTGAYATGTYPVALAGRVPTRVSTKNGAIHVGDTLSASDIPGVAVKATTSGSTVGIALESYDLPQEGMISVFVKTGWQGAPVTESPTSTTPAVTYASGTGSVRSGLAKVYAGSTSVKVTFPTINAFPIIQATPYGEAKGGYWFSNVSDAGFTITLANAPTFDLLFAWSVQPSASGSNIYFSDNTSASFDPLTGNAVPAAPTVPDATSTPDTNTTTTLDVPPPSLETGATTTAP